MLNISGSEAAKTNFVWYFADLNGRLILTPLHRKDYKSVLFAQFFDSMLNADSDIKIIDRTEWITAVKWPFEESYIRPVFLVFCSESCF